MKQFKLFVTSMLLLISVGANADKFTVNTTEFEPGGTVDVSVSLENTGVVSGYTMKLYLPDGFSVLPDEQGSGYICELSSRHENQYNMSLTKASDGSYLFVAYPNNSGVAVKENSGILFTTKLSVASNVNASKMASFKSIAVSDADGTETSFIDVVFDLTKKAPPITVIAKSYTRVYGDANPTFGYEAAGGKLAGIPSITCEATETSPVGEYDIVVTEGSVTSPNVTYVNGKLTITKAPLTVTAKSYTIKRGDALPTLEVDYAGFKNKETIDVLTKKAIAITTATSASELGTYEIVVSGAEAQNYEPSYVKGTLTIIQADPVTVTAKSYTRMYGEENPTFEYTVEGATLDGTPEITCEATATSPVGTYDIVVKQGAVKNYNVTYVAGTLTITKAPLTIAAGTYTKKQGEAMPEFTLTYTGFKNNETNDVLIKQATVNCNATEASAPGEYPVIVSGAEAQNYDISYTNGKLIVVDADAVIVKANSYSRVYGEANPTFEYTVEGAELVGQPVITCEATVTSPVGTYDIIVSKGTVENYNVTYVAGTLTITKAPLNIAAGTYTKKQGDPMPEFTLTYTGFKNNETKDVLTKQPTVNCNATEASAPGEYPVIVSGAESQNYDISYTNGKLIVVDADAVIVKANSYTREYGEENPTFEYTVEGAALDGTPEITCEATATSPVGTYDIVVKQGTVKNYNVTYVAGTLTITKAPLTIAAGTYTKKQGEAMPEFTLTYSGFKNDETKDVLTKQPEVSCQATEASAPGEYPVIVSGAEARNYEISYTNGVLIVTEATGIAEVSVSHPVDVYTLQGNKVRAQATTLKGLPTGIYIVNGRKVRVK